ncbi:hypothetical protein PDESU_05917 [Pontiella desulfatans]|uniref:Uncharacterized protein n=1 Tax=Pontiella desulfatans TaxID=2750659 RepID=A0A6C2UD22_PONDE|nr:hypothetical protein [Pontiella desulfatans]VGO17321.1 hypothetical protein PDESU_05917 [Pontiella desulfatans]
MTRRTRWPAILMAALAASGCSTIYKRVDPGISDQEVSFKINETHFHEVLDKVGPPSRLTAADEGFAFLYEDLLIRELQTGLSGRSGWWQLIKLSFANSKLFRHTAVLRFSREGILLSSAISKSTEGLGIAGAIQPVLSIVQVVDTAQFEDDASEPQRWGIDLLRPIPVTLNNPQSLDSGQGGLEQSGTTTKIGQHTLEMR